MFHQTEADALELDLNFLIKILNTNCTVQKET